MAKFTETIKKAFGFSDPKLGQLAPTDVAPKQVTPSEFADEFGSTGTPIVYGYISEEMNYKLRGSQGSKLFDEMRKTDAQVNASLLTMELPIRATKWYVEPAYNTDGETEEQDEQIAKFVEKCLFEYIDSTWDDFLREILTMLPFGYCVFEKVFAMQETEFGKNIILQKLAYRKQVTIDRRIQQDGTPGITQYLDSPATAGINKGKTTISIPAQKLVIFTYRREGDNYEGTSVLRSAYKHWFIKDKLYKFDAIRHERQGVGIPLLYLPKNATEADKKQAEKIVKNIRATEQTGIVIPGSKNDGWEFEYADLKSSQSTNFKESIEHHNREIVKNILAQFLELGNTESGSRSLGGSQIAYFLMSLESVAKYICDTMDKFVIKQLVDLNYDVQRYPKLRFESLEATDKSQVVDMISSLVGSGIITPDEPLQEYVRDMLDLPAKSAEEAIPTEEPLDISDSADELPTETEDTIDDAELDQYEQELADLEDDQEYGEIVTHIQSIFTDAVEAYSCAFRAPMSEETKQKISEALKQKGGSNEVVAIKNTAMKQLDKINNEIEGTRNEMEKAVGALKDGIETLKSKRSGLTRGKKDKSARAVIRKQIEELHSQMKKARESKKKMMELRKTQRDQIKEVYRQSKKEITSREKNAKKTASLQARLSKQAERARAKAEKVKSENKYHEEGCDCGNHGEGTFFDNTYFTELSQMVNNDFIKQIQNDDE